MEVPDLQEELDPLRGSFFQFERTASETSAVQHLRKENPKYAKSCITDEEIAEASLTSLCHVEFEDLHVAALLVILAGKIAFVAWVRWMGSSMLSVDLALLLPPLGAIVALPTFTNRTPIDSLLLCSLPLDSLVVASTLEAPTAVCVTAMLVVLALLRASIRVAIVSSFVSSAVVVITLVVRGSFRHTDAAVLLFAALASIRGSRVVRDLLLQLSTERIKLERQERIAGAILGRMLPPQVTHKLKGGIKHIAYSHETVTILFAEIQDVSQYAEMYHGEAMVHQMNTVFSRFDFLMQRHAVYKIETVGDVYVACSGVPQANSKHAERCARVALAMLDEIQHFVWPDGKPMEIKVGIHSGPIVSGVIGELLPRYRLFGDTINTASRMCSHNPSTTKVMCTAVTKDLLDAAGLFDVEDGGMMKVKGKGDLSVHFVVAAKEQPEAEEGAGLYNELDDHGLNDDVDSLGYDVDVRIGRAKGRLLAFAVGELLVLILPAGQEGVGDGGTQGVVLSSLSRPSVASLEGSAETDSKSSRQSSVEFAMGEGEGEDGSGEGAGMHSPSALRSTQSRGRRLFSSLAWREAGGAGTSEEILERALSELPVKLGEDKYAIAVQTITGITHTMERSTVRITSSACEAVELTFAGSWLKHEFVTTLTEFTGHHIVDDDLFGDDTGHHNGQHWTADSAMSRTGISKLTRLADHALGLPVLRAIPSASRSMSIASSINSDWDDADHANQDPRNSIGSLRRGPTTPRSLSFSFELGNSIRHDAGQEHGGPRAQLVPAVDVSALHVQRTYSSGLFGAQNTVLRLVSAYGTQKQPEQWDAVALEAEEPQNKRGRSHSMASVTSVESSDGEGGRRRLAARQGLMLQSTRSLDGDSIRRACLSASDDNTDSQSSPLAGVGERRLSFSRLRAGAGDSPSASSIVFRSAHNMDLDRIQSGYPYFDPNTPQAGDDEGRWEVDGLTWEEGDGAQTGEERVSGGDGGGDPADSAQQEEAGATSHQDDTAEQKPAESTQVEETKATENRQAGSDPEGPTREQSSSPVPSGSPCSASGSHHSQGEASYRDHARRNWSRDMAEEGELEDPPQKSAKTLLTTASDALISFVSAVWAEGKPVQAVTPLTRKMLWKLSGGGEADSFIIRDNPRTAEMWNSLLDSLRQDYRGAGWVLKPFSHPLLRSTFSEQCALRVRPTTASSITLIVALLVGGVTYESVSLVDPSAVIAAYMLELLHTLSEDPTCKEATTHELAVKAVFAAWTLAKFVLSALVGRLASTLVRSSTLRLKREPLRVVHLASSAALHTALAVLSGGGSDWPLLVSLVALSAGTALQGAVDSMLHAGASMLIWWLKAAAVGGAAGATASTVVGTVLVLVAYHMEFILSEHFRKVVLVQHEISMTLGICRTLLPGHVIDHMVWSDGKSSPCDRYEEVTILFADIVGFTSMSAKLSPQQLVDLLNNIFSLFDRMALKNKVYKVETIGDCYFCATGLPNKDEEHADNMLRMALDMLDATQNLSSPAGDKIQFRIGIHSGSTVAGVMGEKMPRYHLFGRSVRLASEMEQGGKASKIHISENTSRRLSPAMRALMQGDDPVVFCTTHRARRASLVGKA